MCGRGRSTYSVPFIARTMNANARNLRGGISREHRQQGAADSTNRATTRDAELMTHPAVQPSMLLSVPETSRTSFHIDEHLSRTSPSNEKDSSVTHTLAEVSPHSDLSKPDKVSEDVELDEECHFSPLENISPGMEVPVVYSNPGQPHARYISLMKWGLVPHYRSSHAISDHYKMFNARIESVHEKVSFKNLLSKNRCVVLFNGFYEWIGVSGQKTPYYIRLQNVQPMLLACLYDITRDGVVSFTVLTCDSCNDMVHIHDRQPVILTPSEADRWLDLNQDPMALLSSLRSHKQEVRLTVYQVSPRMTNPKYQGPDCSVPFADVKEEKKKSFFQPKSTKTGNIKQDGDDKSVVYRDVDMGDVTFGKRTRADYDLVDS
jgi:putative SOS response-associated peptidase YedK